MPTVPETIHGQQQPWFGPRDDWTWWQTKLLPILSPALIPPEAAFTHKVIVTGKFSLNTGILASGRRPERPGG